MSGALESLRREQSERLTQLADVVRRAQIARDRMLLDMSGEAKAGYLEEKTVREGIESRIRELETLAAEVAERDRTRARRALEKKLEKKMAAYRAKVDENRKVIPALAAKRAATLIEDDREVQRLSEEETSLRRLVEETYKELNPPSTDHPFRGPGTDYERARRARIGEQLAGLYDHRSQFARALRDVLSKHAALGRLLT